MVGQPAADHRTQNRPHHHRDAEQRHRRATFFGRVDIEQDRLGDRHEGGAEEALQQAKRHDLRQRLRHAAQHGGDDEARHGHHEDALTAELVGEEARRRGHDRRGHDIGRQYPVDLVGTGRHAALHVGQRHVGDGRVERLHDHGQDHARGDRWPVQGTRRGRRQVSHL